MGFRLVNGLEVNNSNMINLPASGTVNPNTPVDLLPGGGTGGAVVGPSSSSSTTTMLFGIGMTYVQGASDTYSNVIPFTPDQLWEVDCANAATTAQLGLRHALSATKGFVHNTASDVNTQTGVFLALGLSFAGGSGRLIGKVQGYSNDLIAVTNTTFKQ